MKRYFVMHLTNRDLVGRNLPNSDRRFEVQVLDEEGRSVAEGYESDTETDLEVAGERIPREVVEAEKWQSAGQGDYVDASGRSVASF